MELTDEDRAEAGKIAQAWWPDDMFSAVTEGYKAGIRAGLDRAAKVCRERSDKHSADGCFGTFIASDMLYRRDEAKQCAAAITASSAHPPER